AQSLAAAHQGLAGQKSAIDGGRWSEVVAGQSYAAAAAAATDRAAEASARDVAIASRPDDPQVRLDAAETSLLQALEQTAGTSRGGARLAAQNRRLLLEDARRDTEAAKKLGASGWRPAAIAALVAFQLGDNKAAYEQAIAAAPQLPPDAPGRLAMELLALFAEARQEAIVAAAREKKDWEPSWMTDVHTTYGILGQHPLGSDRHVANHFDFLRFFGAPDTDLVLDRGLARFPASALLHERLRARLLERGGVDALAAEYEKRVQAADAQPATAWFAGYAALVAAETHRKNQQPDPARAAYQRALALFLRYREQSGKADGEHYVAIAHGGLARLHLQAGDLAGTFAELQRSFAAEPKAASATDGLGITTMQTAEMLKGKALDQKDEALLAQLDAALKALPPEAFELPEYERASRPQGRRRR
ncbi:MAG: hypothetical protein WAT39_07765, partial [Planctomycetota bacterium]